MEVGLLVLLGGWYVFRLLYFAVSIAPDLPPDEQTHVGIMELYSTTAFLVEDSPDSYRFGSVESAPYLYHLIGGKLLALNLFGLDPHLYLRLLNVALAIGTLGAAYLLAAELVRDSVVRLLFVAMASNTLMLTLLSASVSYDNLVNFLAVLCTFLTIRFFRTCSMNVLLALLLSLALGVLTKQTFGPLAVILLIIVLVERRSTVAQDGRRILQLLRQRNLMSILLSVTLVAAWTGVVVLYGGNLVRYGRLQPRCDEVLTVGQCMENRIFARNRIVTLYREGSISFSQAIEATRLIDHPGDRDHALRLLENEREYQRTKPVPLNPFTYMRIVWDRAMKPSIFGIQAHRSMLRQPNSLWPYELILLAGFVLWVRGLQWQRDERWWLYLALLTLSYGLILMGVVNYRTYLRTHALFLGVQGRYLFPVLWTAYLILARSLLRPWGRRMRSVLALLVAGWFIAGDLPYFLQRATPEWFAVSPAAPATRGLARNQGAEVRWNGSD